ncbi:MAG: hypothetical protein WA837_13305, partial [Xanthobacteraceae bacterium]
VMATRSTDSAAASGVAKTMAKIELNNRLDAKRPGKIMSTSNEPLPRSGLQFEYQTAKPWQPEESELLGCLFACVHPHSASAQARRIK